MTLAVIQPSPFCNINCDYCYLPNRTKTDRMGEETLRKVVEGLFTTDLVREEITFVWHAGEPLAVPREWVRITHSFQTNATLLNEEWCDFIKKTGVCMGVSIDGPARIHDAHRKTRSGSGTHDRAMRGISLLKSRGIDFHVIAVVTGDSLDHPDEIFDFFIENGITRFGFNVEEQEGIHEKSSLEGAGSDRIEAFFQRIFERQKALQGAVRVREFDFALQRILGKRAAAEEDFVFENEQVRPFGILNIDWQGNFSTFSPEMLGLATEKYGIFTFGSFLNGGLEASLSNPAFLKVLEDTHAGVERCRRECDFFALCGGGAPANKYFENGTFESTETAYCRNIIQLPIRIVLEDLENSLLQTRPTLEHTAAP
jgi:uncharacterized protein